jgi:hypothetical protein
MVNGAVDRDNEEDRKIAFCKWFNPSSTKLDDWKNDINTLFSWVDWSIINFDTSNRCDKSCKIWSIVWVNSYDKNNKEWGDCTADITDRFSEKDDQVVLGNKSVKITKIDNTTLDYEDVSKLKVIYRESTDKNWLLVFISWTDPFIDLDLIEKVEVVE